MEIDRFLTRTQAAAWITDQTGISVSPRSIEKLKIPYCVLLGKAVYRPADLQQYIAAATRNASRRMGGRGCRGARVAS